MLKVCSKCKLEKPHVEFTKSKHRRDGLNIKCKSCTRFENKQFRLNNPETSKLSSKKWYENNKEIRLTAIKKYRDSNKERYREYFKKWREKNKVKCAQYTRKFYWANREVIAKRSKTVRELNIDLFLERERNSYKKHSEARKAKAKRWRESNPHKVTYHAAKRRADVENRTPFWLTEIDFKLMSDIYAEAKRISFKTGEIYHVDHIIPLRGKKVSGLNVPSNLQILSASENLKKTNKYET